MELNDLGLDYYFVSDALRKRANELKKQSTHLSGLDLIAMNRRIESLRADARECLKIGRLLIKYYKKG